MKIPQSIVKKLNERKESDSLRSLFIAPDGIDFFSNDYLGMARVKFRSELSHGATGSRLISGNFEQTEALESKMATFFKCESGVLFNSGYDANLGFFSVVPQRGDTVLYDTLSHASIRDGIQLGIARSYNFRHNDLVHLESRLKEAKGTIYVAVEAIYSMDGDEAPLKEITVLCEKYGAYLVVDEAHSGGVLGEGGVGLVSALGLDAAVFAKTITFGKAYGSHGAVVLGAQELRAYLINFSRSLIYTTALPPSSIDRLAFALDFVKEAEAERKQLISNIQLFKELAKQSKLNILESSSPIQGVVIPGNSTVKSKAKELGDKGFLVKAILSPTVPEGEERIRICLHSYNTEEEIIKLINQLV